MESYSVWHERNVRYKEDKVVVKLRDEQGAFLKSIHVPTNYYPLNGKYEVFHYRNTAQVTDKNVLAAFDEVVYKIGHCYSNTKELLLHLKRKGYMAVPYVGWLFTSSYDIPIHHCWAVVIGPEGKSILDLGDDYCVMLSEDNQKNFDTAQNIEEMRLMIASFQEWAGKHPNSMRCAPVGIPAPFLLYVGCPCDPDEGRMIYQRLMRQYPDHECESNCDKDGMNAQQRIFKERGLM